MRPMARAPHSPPLQAITIERVPEGIRARAWVASGVARFWQPLEEDVLASEEALTRWMASVDARHLPRAAVLVGAELRSDTALMNAIKRGMK
jgi:hypothetical protein